MDFVLGMVLDRVRKASPQELRDFAWKLAPTLSGEQLRIIGEAVTRELERRVPDQGTATRWGL